MEITNTLKRLSDDELLRRLTSLVRDHRRVEAELIAHIAEVDERRLYAEEATSSMFGYCTERLNLSEGEAFLRIQVARATRQHPMLLDALADGRIHVTGLGKLVPHLTPENRDELLERATHKSKREIEELVAELRPRPEVPTSVRKLPARPAPKRADAGAGAGREPFSGPTARNEPRPDEVQSAPAPPARRTSAVQPIAPERYKIQFTADVGLKKKLERLQALMRTTVPDGDLAALIALAVTEKLERLEAKRFGKVKKPRKSVAEADTSPGSRDIAAPVRREVHGRDDECCAFRDEKGRRCRERARLEYHHARPYGKGGDRGVGNIRLLCRTHNLLMAERDYGKVWMEQFRRTSDRAVAARASPDA